MKKAETDISWPAILGFILVVSLLIVLFFNIAQFSLSTKYERTFLGNDLNLFLYTLESSPNPVIVKYPENTYGFTYFFSTEELKLYDTEDSSLSLDYERISDNNIIIEEKTINTENSESSIEIKGETQGLPLIFVKQDDEIIPYKGLLVGETT